jgi:WD40 repeat protein
LAFFAEFSQCAHSQNRIVLSGNPQEAKWLSGPPLIYGKPCGVAAFAPNGRYLALGEISENKLTRFDLRTLRQMKSVSLPDSPLSFSFDKDGSFLVVAYEKHVDLLDTSAWSVHRSIALSPNEFPVVASSRKILMVQNHSGGKYLYSLSRIVSGGKTINIPKQANTQFNGGIAISPDGRFAAMGGDDYFWVIDLNSFKTIKVVSLKDHSFSGKADVISFSKDGRLLCVYNSDSLPAEYRFGTWKFVTKLTSNGNRQGVFTLVYSANSKNIVTLNVRGEIQFWNTDTGELLDTRRAKTGDISFLDLSIDFKSIVLIERDGNTTVWKIP